MSTVTEFSQDGRNAHPGLAVTVPVIQGSGSNQASKSSSIYISGLRDCPASLTCMLGFRCLLAPSGDYCLRNTQNYTRLHPSCSEVA